ncbi:heme exporter protein CcmD [Devosia sp. XJ19-1]|uniref:Heme exporter protein D n=1 Tax=Devosia ureilytica TaxID=2952754 RepID=A0A9Q4ANC9_9HYPH|nr:heme exporter protein CcmD [Devosia ureilytica]MCP8882866.1 heme exporter protein CcmD [Devosia ureilytica]MCP8886766.1 heme exporter protein CcmD [Devosia ureilytica]
MIDLGQHAQFITAAYAGVFLGLFALIGWIVVESRRVKARLAELGDKRG